MIGLLMHFIYDLDSESNPNQIPLMCIEAAIPQAFRGNSSIQGSSVNCSNNQ